MDPQDKLISLKVRVRLREALFETLRMVAAKEQRSVASMIGVLLDEAITARSST